MTNLFIALGYFGCAAAVLLIEYNQYKRRGADSFHVLVFFYALYVLLPSVFIHSLLFWDGTEETGIFYFDSVFRKLDAVQSLTLFALNGLFLFGLYAIRLFSLRTVRPAPKYDARLSVPVTVLWVGFGVAVCGTFFLGLGEDLIGRYANLILFRLQDETSERNFFTANAFAITQTFIWLCSGLVFLALRSRRYAIAFGVALLTLLFALLMGSRRALIFPFVIVFLCFFLAGARIPYKRLSLLIPIALLWIAFGKELTGAVARGQQDIRVGDIYDSPSSAALRAFSDIGITQINSYAVLQNFEMDPRFGVDHILSFLRRIPGKEYIGIPLEIYPERITRVTTAAFTSADDDDIPPGLLGASWLDLPFIGAIFWGLGLGFQTAIVENMRRKVAPSATSAMIATLVMLVVCLPVGTGTYDFTVSVDIVMLLAILATSCRIGVIKNGVVQPKLGANSRKVRR